jgi:DNA-binding transcriptional MerR regulator
LVFDRDVFKGSSGTIQIRKSSDASIVATLPDILKPKKNKKGNRLFTERDVKYLHMIYHLVKEKGYTLQGAKDELKNNIDEVENKIVVLETLHHLKNFLVALDQELATKK